MPENDPLNDYIYMFTIYLSRQLTQIELLNLHMQKMLETVSEGEFIMSNPVVSLLFRYYRQLTDDEVTDLADGVRKAVDEHKIEYLKIELAHVGRAEKALEDEDDEDESTTTVPEGDGDIQTAPDSLV